MGTIAIGIDLAKVTFSTCTVGCCRAGGSPATKAPSNGGCELLDHYGNGFTRSTPERAGNRRSARPEEGLTNKMAPSHARLISVYGRNPMNEIGLPVRFLP